MATKTNLLSTINGFITAIITQAKVRSAYSTVVDELYPTKVSDTSSSETYTTKTADFFYSIQIVKQGRSVRINGFYTSLRSYALPSGTRIFALKNNEYKGDTSEYLGINVKHVPTSEIQTTNVTPQGGGASFSITYNSNT